jgi:hypothetical protein
MALSAVASTHWLDKRVLMNGHRKLTKNQIPPTTFRINQTVRAIDHRRRIAATVRTKAVNTGKSHGLSSTSQRNMSLSTANQNHGVSAASRSVPQKRTSEQAHATTARLINTRVKYGELFMQPNASKLSGCSEPPESVAVETRVLGSEQSAQARG